MIKAEIGNEAIVHCMQMDVCDKYRIAECAKEAVAKFGDVDIIINNAGVVQGKLFHEMSELKASKSMTINCESHFWIVK